jgi:outer membrane protein
MKNITLLLLLLCNLVLHSQTLGPLLTPEEAVQIALERNYDIQLSRADSNIAALNNTRANAGQLPTVNLVVNETANINAFQEATLADGRIIGGRGAFNNNVNAAVQLNWTLYDGRRMYIAKRRLESLERQSTLNLKNAIQNTAAQVLQAYYDIVRSRLQERATEEVIRLNEERLRIAEARLAAGFAAQTDALQARIDLNLQRANLIQQQNVTATNRRTLNQLLVRNPETVFSVNENLNNLTLPNINTLREKILRENPALLSLIASAEIAAHIVEESRTLNKPRITGTAQVNALRADNAASFQLNNTVAGAAVGAQLVLPIFTGGNLRRQEEVAKLGAQQANYRIENQKLVLEAALDNQISFFQTQQQTLRLEEDNVTLARESLNVSTERFRSGITNGLEAQIAQNALEQVLARRNLVLYNLKITEIQLRLLAGDL